MVKNNIPIIYLAKKLNLLKKEDRIVLFQAILYPEGGIIDSSEEEKSFYDW